MLRDIFIWKALHNAIVAVKDDQIRQLREDLAVARVDRLRAETGRDVAVQQMIEMSKPKPVEAPRLPRFVPRTQQDQDPASEPKTLDLAEVDPTDTKAIRDIALKEMPSGKHSASHLLQKMESLRSQAVIAQAAKRSRAKEPGIISAPESVMEKIAAAEQEGIDRARVN